MTKNELNKKTDAAVSETREALQVVFDALNHGQQKKLVSNEAVAKVLERYGVNVNI